MVLLLLVELLGEYGGMGDAQGLCTFMRLYVCLYVAVQVRATAVGLD